MNWFNSLSLGWVLFIVAFFSYDYSVQSNNKLPQKPLMDIIVYIGLIFATAGLVHIVIRFFQ